MWVKVTGRKGLLEVLSGNATVQASGGFDSKCLPDAPIHDGELSIVWDCYPSSNELPSLIVIPTERHRDFFAWTSTYFPTYKPFTAFFRVVDSTRIPRYSSISDSPRLDSFEASCIGLIIGEALTLAADSGIKTPLSVIGCSSTLSYSLARTMALGMIPDQTEKIVINWSIARKLIEQTERKLDSLSIKSVWEVLVAVYMNKNNVSLNVPTEIVEACSQIKEKGWILDNTWGALTKNVENLVNAQEKMKAPREDRVRFFEKITASDFTSDTVHPNVRAFIYGYLASLIGPGSLAYSDLLTQHVPRHRTVLLWYGLCAGLIEKNEVLGSFNVLGRRLLRDLLRNESLMTPPSADISVSELEVLLGPKFGDLDFRTFSSSYINIELFPFVSTFATLQRRGQDQQQTIFSGLPPAFFNELFRMGAILDEVANIHEQLVTFIKPEGSVGRSKRQEKRKGYKGRW
jgi:hypothetical protein